MKRLFKRLRDLLVIVAISLLTLGAEKMHMLSGFETTMFDGAFHFNRPLTHFRDKKPLEDKIVLVAIDQRDYKDNYKNNSPLDPKNLSKLLQSIVDAGPAVIAVDIDTSASQFSELAQLEKPPSTPVFVWATGAAEYFDDNSLPATCADGSAPPEGVNCTDGSTPMKKALCSEGDFVPFDIGGEDRKNVIRGIALSEQDRDGAIRRIPVSYQTCSGQMRSPMHSFPVAIAEQWARVAGRNLETIANDGEDLYFKRYAFGDPTSSRYISAPKDSLAGKIVIVGGSYAQADDLHRTAMGPELGMKIVASQVASLIDGSARPAKEWFMLLVDILVGVIMVVINEYYRHRSLTKAMLISLIAIPVLAMVASFAVFASMAYWVCTIPVSVSVLIHQFFEHAVEYRQLYLANSGSTHE